MRKMAALAFSAILMLSAAGCAPGQGINKQTGGAVLGGIGGGVIGSQIGKGQGKTVAIIAGTVLGALLGGEIGRQLDERDRLLMGQRTQATLERAPSGQTSEWRNPDTGNHGTITPKPAYKNPEGEYCREFQQTVTVGGQTQQAYGTACRQPDGTWKIVQR